MHFVSRAMPIDNIDGKSHKMELKSSHNYSAIIQSQNHATRYSGPWERTHTHAQTYARTHTHPPTYTHTRTLKVISKTWCALVTGLGMPGLKSIKKQAKLAIYQWFMN